MPISPFAKAFSGFVLCALISAGFEIARVLPLAFVFMIFAIVCFIGSIVAYLKTTKRNAR